MKKFPTLTSPAILSPMAGVTDVAFRALCKKYGAGMTCTEFVSSAALVRGSRRSQEMLAVDPCESPVAVQLFGANDAEIVAAAKLVQDNFDVIDMNCGCPAWKVIKTGAGSALLNEPDKIARLIRSVVSAVNVPVTVKIRAGIDDKHINAVEVALAAEAAGAAAIAVHGRTQRQGYRGTADWNVVKAVKDAVKIPVIGNGDVFSAQDFVRLKAESGCDCIMVARGAIGNPAIFAEINAVLAGTAYTSPTKQELFAEYLELAQLYNISFSQVKNHAMHFTKGIEGGAKLREHLTHVQDIQSISTLMRRVAP